jgi:hypothetical protein
MPETTKMPEVVFQWLVKRIIEKIEKDAAISNTELLVDGHSSQKQD